MGKWQCVECGYFFDGTKPPDRCPGCQASCTYADVTCYRPECGGPLNTDPMLLSMISQRIGLAAPLQPARPAKAPQDVVYAEKVTREALFQGLDEKEIRHVLSIAETRDYEPGDTVFKEGSDAVHIYIVEDGELAIRTVAGKTAYTAAKGDILGWSALVLPYQRTASAIASKKSRILVIDQGRLQQFCEEENSPIGLSLIHI